MPFQASRSQKRLADRLAEARKATGLSSQHVADQFGWQQSKVSRIENAQVKVIPADVSKLADLYELPADLAARMCTMARDSRTDFWWQRFEPWVSESYYTLIGYENDATRLRSNQSTVVPGLLQIRDYTSALIANSPMIYDPDTADALIEVRMLRQRRLREPVPLQLDALIAESVLHWEFGGREVLHAQLRHLREMTERPNVTIRVVPFTAAQIVLPLELYEFGANLEDSVAFSETPWTNTIHDGPLEARRAHRVIDRMESLALPPEDSTMFIEQRIRESK
jgi:transcriptional regulator with XRE-family HTH domain